MYLAVMFGRQGFCLPLCPPRLTPSASPRMLEPQLVVCAVPVTPHSQRSDANQLPLSLLSYA